MTTAPTRHDVVVVGARCAGAATAMLLARAGADVLVLDAARPGTDTLSTHALMRGGVVQLRRWGLLDAVVAGGAPAITRTVFTHDDGVVTPVEVSGEALRAPRRTLLDPVLVAAAREAGADVRSGALVRDLVRDDDGTVGGVRWTDKATGTAHTALAPLVVGADGRRSSVARAVAAPVTAAGRHAGAVVVGYWPDLPSDAYRWYYAAGATAGVVPTDGGLACVWAGVPATRFGADRPRDLEEYLRRVLHHAAPDLEPVGPTVGPVRAHPGTPGYVRRAAGPGWALVGDAGYFKDPLTAHGITDALRDADLLSRAVLSAPPGGRAAALRRFEHTRDSLSRDLFRLTDRIASYDWDPATLRDLLRQLSRAMRPEVTHLTGLDTVPAAPAA